MCERISDELLGIEMGDERLNKRSRKVLEALAANPEASINGAVNGWADTQAAYRFFDNENVTPEQILEPHLAATLRRMQEHPVAIIAQDTTELDYSDHPTRDALCLNRDDRHGIYHHVQLAFTEDRLPLGIVATECFDRAPETLGKAKDRKHDPIETKESYRWLKGYRHACELASRCPETRIVSVADREADIYDIFLDAQGQTAPKADYIVRAHEDRSTPELNRDVSRRTYQKVLAVVAQSPERMRYTINLCETPKRSARQATIAVRAIAVTVKPPNDRNHLDVITHNVILVEEQDGPGDDTEVRWLLLTTLPIDSVNDVQRVVNYYTARWGIETYFRTLKTGCQVEKIQLETKSRLLNCLAFYNIIAWRILYLTYLNRTCPDLPCTAVFADPEWKPVWCVVKRRPLPKNPPKLNEFLRLLAHLGGYNNRPKEPPPGPQPLWVGLRRMLDYSVAWLTFGPERTEVVCK
jgi:Transposase DNA-binding/Transposase Tn5 dimerisation domain